MKKTTQTDGERIQKALDVAVEYGCVDGAHHKAWVIDQMVRALAGCRYHRIVRAACFWDTGIAP